MVFQDPFASLNPLHTVSYHSRARSGSTRTAAAGARPPRLDKLLTRSV